MNYRKIYVCIIKNAILENRKKHDGVYYERHHILPKSIFPLWKNKKSNTVLLTAREHFFCHQLLMKIYPGHSMAFALKRMMESKNKNYKISSKEYQRTKENIKPYLQTTKGKHPFNNGEVTVYSEVCPSGFKPGFKFYEIKNHWSKKYVKKPIEDKPKKKHWWTNGIENSYSFECPNGFHRGVTRKRSNEFYGDFKCYCQYCGRECKNKMSLINHERLCYKNPNRQKIENYIWTKNFNKYLENA